MDNSFFNPRGPVHPSALPSKTTTQNPALESVTTNVVSTPEIQNWMSAIEQHLNEVCSIAADGKLNSEQKLKISTPCHKVYAYDAVDAFQEERDLSKHIADLKQTIKDFGSAGNISFADMKKNSK